MKSLSCKSTCRFIFSLFSLPFRVHKVLCKKSTRLAHPRTQCVFGFACAQSFIAGSFLSCGFTGRGQHAAMPRAITPPKSISRYSTPPGKATPFRDLLSTRSNNTHHTTARERAESTAARTETTETTNASRTTETTQTMRSTTRGRRRLTSTRARSNAGRRRLTKLLETRPRARARRSGRRETSRWR